MHGTLLLCCWTHTHQTRPQHCLMLCILEPPGPPRTSKPWRHLGAPLPSAGLGAQQEPLSTSRQGSRPLQELDTPHPLTPPGMEHPGGGGCTQLTLNPVLACPPTWNNLAGTMTHPPGGGNGEQGAGEGQHAAPTAHPLSHTHPVTTRHHLAQLHSCCCRLLLRRWAGALSTT